MSTAQQDTEITLGTGRMLAIFFVIVLLGAVIFGIGFSLGRKTAMASTGTVLAAPIGTPATIVRPSPAKNDTTQPAAKSGDFTFYKAVGDKNADSALTPQDSKTPAPATTAEAAPTVPTEAATPAPASGSYFVQVAAVSRQEDADSLVEALKKKQYPAFIADNVSVDKFHHVQVGPYADMKQAEAMRARLIGDGYNPIVKR